MGVSLRSLVGLRRVNRRCQMLEPWVSRLVVMGVLLTLVVMGVLLTLAGRPQESAGTMGVSLGSPGGSSPGPHHGNYLEPLGYTSELRPNQAPTLRFWPHFRASSEINAATNHVVYDGSRVSTDRGTSGLAGECCIARPQG